MRVARMAYSLHPFKFHANFFAPPLFKNENPKLGVHFFHGTTFAYSIFSQTQK
jgi:hypothetical protein